MTDDELITHLAVGNFDDPEPNQPGGSGCWLIVAVMVFTLLYILV